MNKQAEKFTQPLAVRASVTVGTIVLAIYAVALIAQASSAI